MGFLSWLSSVFGTSGAPQPETKIISWEIGNPEREAWTILAYNAAFSAVYIFNSATDIYTIRPDWDKLGPLSKCKVIIQLLSAISFFESSWDPANATLDVGGTDSLGLMQVSIEDQANYGLPLGYSRADLLTVGPNLKLALAILVQQIQVCKKLICTKEEFSGVPSGDPREGYPYWSTFSYGFEDQKIDKIIEMVQALSFD